MRTSRKEWSELRARECGTNRRPTIFLDDIPKEWNFSLGPQADSFLSSLWESGSAYRKLRKKKRRELNEQKPMIVRLEKLFGVIMKPVSSNSNRVSLVLERLSWSDFRSLNDCFWYLSDPLVCWQKEYYTRRRERMITSSELRELKRVKLTSSLADEIHSLPEDPYQFSPSKFMTPIVWTRKQSRPAIDHVTSHRYMCAS